jgi:hypothetical protein
MSCSSSSDSDFSDDEGLFTRTEYIQIPVKGDKGTTGNTGNIGNDGKIGPKGDKGERGAGVLRQGINMTTDYMFSPLGQVLPMTLYVNNPNIIDSKAVVTFAGSGSSLLGPGHINFVLNKNGVPMRGMNAAVIPVGGGTYKWNIGFSHELNLEALQNHVFTITGTQYNTNAVCNSNTNPLNESFTLSIFYGDN